MATRDRDGTVGTVPQSSGWQNPPDLRLLHYNDVYHIEYLRLTAD